MEIKIFNDSILNATTDIIVNAANKNLLVGGGVCKAIFDKAGLEQLQEECKKIGHCKTGHAVITNGFNLSSKYIIHAVGPHYYLDKNPQNLLELTYLSSLKLADETRARSIAFPCISTGIFCFPLEEATKIALNAILNYNAKTLKSCHLYCYTTEEYQTYLKIFNNFKKISDKTINLLKKIDDFYKSHINKHHSSEDMKAFLKEQEKIFALLEKLTWEDITMLTKEDLKKITPAILYDWSHITANYDKQEEIQKLFNEANSK